MLIMTVEEVTSENFDEFVSNGNVIIDFSADWCGPCKMLGPQFFQASEDVNDVKFGKVNVDKARDLASRFQVMSIPTIIFFKDKEQVERISGGLSSGEIVKRVEKVFG